MTREEIIRLAREAGLALVYSEQDEDGWEELGRFAALIAAAEREACAKLETEAGVYSKHDLAEAIRARGKQE